MRSLAFESNLGLQLRRNWTALWAEGPLRRVEHGPEDVFEALTRGRDAVHDVCSSGTRVFQ